MVDIQEARRLKQKADEKKKREDYQYFVDFMESEIDARIVEAAKKGCSVVSFTVGENNKVNSLVNLQHIIYDTYHAAGYIVNTRLVASRYIEIYIYWSNSEEGKEE